MNPAAALPRPARHVHPTRRALFRGLAVILPPLLTVVVFLWAWNMIDVYILVPCEKFAGHLIVWSIKDVKTVLPPAATEQPPLADQPAKFQVADKVYVKVGTTGKWIPETVWAKVQSDPGEAVPATPAAYYDRYVILQYLRRERTFPIFLALFVLILYVTGKFMAAGVGRFIGRMGTRIVDRMPIVRDVYSAVKQITDSIFSEHEVEFLRVVAVEYPRKGLWQIAFVTGEGFKDLREAAGEPIVSLLISHSPIPATGFTCTALKRDTIDLNITVDQAMQYIVSCGVVVPPHQQWNGKPRDLNDDISRKILEQAARAEELVKSS